MKSSVTFYTKGEDAKRSILALERAWTHTLGCECEINKIETAAGQFALFVVLLAQTERRCRSRTLFDRRITPQVRSAVSVRDVQQGDALQGRAVGQVQRHSVALVRQIRDSHFTGIRTPLFIYYHDVDIFVQVLARSGERFRGGELKVPQLVLHPAVELVGILLAFRMEFHANGRILCISYGEKQIIAKQHQL